MRSFRVFVSDVARKPPVVMPYVAAAHVLGLVWTLWRCLYVPLGIEWLQLVWMLGYTVFWVAACDLRKWGAIGYILLMMTNCAIYLLAKNIYDRELYMSSLFLLDAMFSFYLLFFFKRFV